MEVKSLFYIFGILALYWEMMHITDTKEMLNFHKTMDNTLSTDGEFTSRMVVVSLLELGYVLWCFVGLFSINWLPFLILMVLRFIPQNNENIMRIVGISCFSVIVFVILNSYHFKIQFHLW